jgi:hypothetical protein
LQLKLQQTGALLEIPETLADTSRSGWTNNFV